jgi:hypothetical protein
MSGGLELLERIKQNGGIFSADRHQRPLIDSVHGEAEDSKYIGTMNQVAVMLYSFPVPRAALNASSSLGTNLTLYLFGTLTNCV